MTYLGVACPTCRADTVPVGVCCPWCNTNILTGQIDPDMHAQTVREKRRDRALEVTRRSRARRRQAVTA